MHDSNVSPLYTARCVTEAAAALQAHSIEVTSLLSIQEHRTLTEAELGQLEAIYNRMDSIESQLIRTLNPTELEIN